MNDPFSARSMIARNTAWEHAGSIHDDDAAKRFGYSGGLVPGITLYAYMGHSVVEAWGLDWVAHGTMASRSDRPVYEGESITISGRLVLGDPRDDKTVELKVADDDGRAHAVGRAALPRVPPAMRQPTGDLLPLSDDPPVADPGTVHVGDKFGSSTCPADYEELTTYLDRVGEDYAAYRREGVFPPAYLQGVTTRWERASFRYSTPTIYVASSAQHLRPVRVGDQLRGNGEVLRVYERNGHHYLDVEQVVVANESDVVAVVRRTSIYHVRARAEASI